MIITKDGIIVENVSQIIPLNEFNCIDKTAYGKPIRLSLSSTQLTTRHGARIKGNQSGVDRDNSNKTDVVVNFATNSIDLDSSHTAKLDTKSQSKTEWYAVVNTIKGLCGYMDCDLETLINMDLNKVKTACKGYSKLNREEQQYYIDISDINEIGKKKYAKL